MKDWAPSINQFRSEADYERAMEIWCAENEPAYRLYDYDEKTDTYRPIFKSRLDLFCCTYTGTHRKRYSPPGVSRSGGCQDKLSGGSRADYRMAGITRY